MKMFKWSVERLHRVQTTKRPLMYLKTRIIPLRRHHRIILIVPLVAEVTRSPQMVVRLVTEIILLTQVE